MDGGRNGAWVEGEGVDGERWAKRCRDQREKERKKRNKSKSRRPFFKFQEKREKNANPFYLTLERESIVEVFMNVTHEFGEIVGK